MSSDVDAVIAALRIVLREAERRTTQHQWKIRIVNRWIDQLPGAWSGRWRLLKLPADYDGMASRDDLISHVRATLAYLEVNGDAIAARRWWQSRKSIPVGAKADEVAMKLVGSDPKEIADSDTASTTRPKWLN